MNYYSPYLNTQQCEHVLYFETSNRLINYDLKHGWLPLIPQLIIFQDVKHKIQKVFKLCLSREKLEFQEALTKAGSNPAN